MRKVVVDAGNIRYLNFKELFEYRDLFLILTYRDLRVRYAQTFLGLLWAVIQPLATLLILTVIFGRAIKVDTGTIPYPLFAAIGMSLWTYFAFVLSQSGNSIIQAQNMVKKIYFPRLIIPLAKSFVGLVDFMITIVLVVLLFIYFDLLPEFSILLVVFILLTILAALGAGIWLSALTIRFRDFQHITPFLVQLGLYLTPVAYPASTVVEAVPQWVSVLYFLNPMAGIVEGFRWSLTGGPFPPDYVYISFGVAVLLFATGIIYFKRVENLMADYV